MTPQEIQGLIFQYCRRSSINVLHRERAIVSVLELEPALQEYIQTLKVFVGELDKPSVIPRMRSILDEYRRCRMLNPGGWEVWKIPVGLVRHQEDIPSCFRGKCQCNIFFRVNPGEVSLYADDGQKLDLTEGKGYWMQNEPAEFLRKERG